MDLQQRLDLMVRLGKFMLGNNEEWVAIKERAARDNAWFTDDFITLSVNNICHQFLDEAKLTNWAKSYAVQDFQPEPKNVGVVMAGNIPLVGFHDFLCVFISGHQQTIKASSKDDLLIKFIVKKLYEWEITIQNYVSFAENLKGCDAYIATGSNNSSRYFEYYFGKFPNIIRRNRTSIAILDGTETENDLDKLSDDIQLYFGLGCRNITKLYVPQAYDFIPLLDALRKYDHYFLYHKYKHNYDYQLALLMMGNKFYMTNESVVFAENESIFSPVSQVNYEFYDDAEALKQKLIANIDIQCIVGNGFTAFGTAQQPSLTDYADGIDTMTFVTTL
ncbi:MAG: acyl-CoA reductase [Pedobacter sp.]|nr:acyl-CoA reductase [Chitinophagaceae bacterium]